MWRYEFLGHGWGEAARGRVQVIASLHHFIAMQCNAVQCTRMRVRAIVQRCNTLYRVGSVVECTGTVPYDAWKGLRPQAP
jgi:hypothetical protein